MKTKAKKSTNIMKKKLKSIIKQAQSVHEVNKLEEMSAKSNPKSTKKRQETHDQNQNSDNQPNSLAPKPYLTLFYLLKKGDLQNRIKIKNARLLDSDRRSLFILSSRLKDHYTVSLIQSRVCIFTTLLFCTAMLSYLSWQLTIVSCLALFALYIYRKSIYKRLYAKYTKYIEEVQRRYEEEGDFRMDLIRVEFSLGEYFDKLSDMAVELKVFRLNFTQEKKYELGAFERAPKFENRCILLEGKGLDSGRRMLHFEGLVDENLKKNLENEKNEIGADEELGGGSVARDEVKESPAPQPLPGRGSPEPKRWLNNGGKIKSILVMPGETRQRNLVKNIRIDTFGDKKIARIVRKVRFSKKRADQVEYTKEPQEYNSEVWGERNHSKAAKAHLGMISASKFEGLKDVDSIKSFKSKNQRKGKRGRTGIQIDPKALKKLRKRLRKHNHQSELSSGRSLSRFSQNQPSSFLSPGSRLQQHQQMSSMINIKITRVQSKNSLQKIPRNKSIFGRKHTGEMTDSSREVPYSMHTLTPTRNRRPKSSMNGTLVEKLNKGIMGQKRQRGSMQGLTGRGIREEDADDLDAPILGEEGKFRGESEAIYKKWDSIRNKGSPSGSKASVDQMVMERQAKVSKKSSEQVDGDKEELERHLNSSNPEDQKNDQKVKEDKEGDEEKGGEGGEQQQKESKAFLDMSSKVDFEPNSGRNLIKKVTLKDARPSKSSREINSSSLSSLSSSSGPRSSSGPSGQKIPKNEVDESLDNLEEPSDSQGSPRVRRQPKTSQKRKKSKKKKKKKKAKKRPQKRRKNDSEDDSSIAFSSFSLERENEMVYESIMFSKRVQNTQMSIDEIQSILLSSVQGNRLQIDKRKFEDPSEDLEFEEQDKVAIALPLSRREAKLRMMAREARDEINSPEGRG